MDKEEKARVRGEQERIAAAQAKQDKEPDPMVYVQFRNEEDPPSEGHPSPPISFTYNRKRYTLAHGQELDLPQSVVNHLNQLAVPLYGDRKDPLTGAVQRVVIGRKNRFACVTIPKPKPQTKKKSKE